MILRGGLRGGINKQYRSQSQEKFLRVPQTHNPDVVVKGGSELFILFTVWELGNFISFAEAGVL